MTTQELINITKLLYPSAHSDAELVSFMNLAQNELSPYFGIIVEDNTLVTVADQDSYSFPTGLNDVAQIISLGVASKETPDTRYGYTKYDIITRDDYPVGSCVYFQTVDASGTKKLVIQPTPMIDLSVYNQVSESYLTELDSSTSSASPDFDSRFRDTCILCGTYGMLYRCITGHHTGRCVHAEVSKFIGRTVEVRCRLKFLHHPGQTTDIPAASRTHAGNSRYIKHHCHYGGKRAAWSD